MEILKNLILILGEKKYEALENLLDPNLIICCNMFKYKFSV